METHPIEKANYLNSVCVCVRGAEDEVAMSYSDAEDESEVEVEEPEEKAVADMINACKYG